jgi:fucose permease
MMIHPSGGQPPAGLWAARGLATLMAYLVFFQFLSMLFPTIVCLTVALACVEQHTDGGGVVDAGFGGVCFELVAVLRQLSDEAEKRVL